METGNPFIDGLARSPLSQAIQMSSWLIPALQTVHILGIAVIAGCAAMVALRLFRPNSATGDVAAASRPYLRALHWSVAVMLATGVVLIIGEPGRTLQNPIFFTKMALVLIALGVTAGLRRVLTRDGPVKLYAVAWLLLWVAIVFAGRWIAYASEY